MNGGASVIAPLLAPLPYPDKDGVIAELDEFVCPRGPLAEELQEEPAKIFGPRQTTWPSGASLEK